MLNIKKMTKIIKIMNGIKEHSGVTVCPLKSSVNVSIYHFSDRARKEAESWRKF
jgi:hypothetical protein